MTPIILKLRDLINDNSKTFVDEFEYAGISKVFTLTEPNAVSTGMTVYKNGTLMTTGYTFNSTNCKLTITASLTTGDIIEVNYTAYEKYSDTELKGYIRSALVYISTEKYQDFRDRCDKIFPTPSQGEENMIALIASLLINRSVNSYRTPEITINFTEKQSIDEKIKQVVLNFKSRLGNFDFHKLSYLDNEDKLYE